MALVLLAVTLLAGCQGYKVKTRWINERSINPDDPRATSDMGYGNAMAQELDGMIR